MRTASNRITSFLAVLFFIGSVNAVANDNPFTAVKSLDQNILVDMIARGVNVNARDDSGQTPLMLAATQNESTKLIDLLVHQGADIRARDKHGMTALMHAAAKGEMQNAELLLQLGIDPDIKDNSGKTVMDHAMAGDLNNEPGNKTSFVSMLKENHDPYKSPAYAFYIPYKPGTISTKEFEQAVIRALTRKHWSITELSGTTARAFYARVKRRELYKVEVVQEPTRIAIRFRPGFGTLSERAYLEHIRSGLMHELVLY